MKTLSSSSTLGDVVNFIVGIIGLILPVLLGLSFLAFLFGIVKFIFKSGEKDHTEGIYFIKWSLIAIFILVSFMGIISFFYSDLGFTSVKTLGIPLLPPYK
jgi:uncharacterized protein YqgC (DUF456 family)